MGTRHLTIVQKDNQYKVAQYGQWDGYPSGAGMVIKNFLSTWNLNTRNKKINSWKRKLFERNLDLCSFYTDTDIDFFNLIIDYFKIDYGEITTKYPNLTRDAGSGILELIEKKTLGLKLKNEIDFAEDSLFCEWAYVINLDEDHLEVYQGFNKKPLKKSDRFYSDKKYVEVNTVKYFPAVKYFPVKLKKKFSFKKLKILSEKEFIEICDSPEEER